VRAPLIKSNLNICEIYRDIVLQKERKMATKEERKDPVETEHDWFFDIIINFLRSPRWKTPIMSFLDEYCIIFDNEEENKLEYTSIHNEFKRLVDELIGCLIAELGVT